MSWIRGLLERTPPWTFALGRIMLGAMWLVSLRWKLPPDFMPGEGVTGLRTWLERQVETPAFGFYGDLIDSVVLPNFTLFAWLVFLVELAIGLSLLLGIFIRPAALVGALMSITLWIGMKDVPGEWHWTYVLMLAWHLAVMASPLATTWSLHRRLSGRAQRLSGVGERFVPDPVDRGSLAAALLRVTLGVVTLVTWIGNIDKDFYAGDNLAGFFAWVATPVADGGNGSSLGFVHSFIDSTILQSPGFFGWVFAVVELFIAVGLILGLFTRAASLAAVGFFGSLFLTYFGGHEWIFIYVLLVTAAGATFLGWGGRQLGVDHLIARRRQAHAQPVS
jgi:thiosulfate dehydrogenase (quinone) large subunit